MLAPCASKCPDDESGAGGLSPYYLSSQHRQTLPRAHLSRARGSAFCTCEYLDEEIIVQGVEHDGPCSPKGGVVTIKVVYRCPQSYLLV